MGDSRLLPARLPAANRVQPMVAETLRLGACRMAVACGNLWQAASYPQEYGARKLAKPIILLFVYLPSFLAKLFNRIQSHEETEVDRT